MTDDLRQRMIEAADADLGDLLSAPPEPPARDDIEVGPRSHPRVGRRLGAAAAVVALAVGISAVALNSRAENTDVNTSDSATAIVTAPDPLPADPQARLREAVERTRAAGPTTTRTVLINDDGSSLTSDQGIGSYSVAAEWTYANDVVGWSWESTSRETAPIRVLLDRSANTVYWEESADVWRSATVDSNQDVLPDPLTNLESAACATALDDGQIAVFTTSTCPSAPTGAQADMIVTIDDEGQIEKLSTRPFPDGISVHQDIIFGSATKPPTLPSSFSSDSQPSAAIRWNGPDSWPTAER